MQKREKAREELKKTELKLQEIQAWEGELAKISQQIIEARRLDEQINKLKDQPAKIKEDLKQYERIGNLNDAQKRYRHEKELENRRKHLQKQSEDFRGKVKETENNLRRIEKSRKGLQAAEKKVLLCSVAHQAVDHAVQALGSGLLDKVRRSIRTWAEYFTFLDEFDIEVTPGQLIPIIQAKGYQYKLNQMSKSERIFLYLMLKLAIGDALGHLGAFILDDPADGLDSRRKQTLVYLLLEIARKRQVIVTTNDSSFAELFPQASQINL